MSCESFSRGWYHDLEHLYLYNTHFVYPCITVNLTQSQTSKPSDLRLGDNPPSKPINDVNGAAIEHLERSLQDPQATSIPL